MVYIKRVLGRFKDRMIYMMRSVYKIGIDPRTLINYEYIFKSP